MAASADMLVKHGPRIPAGRRGPVAVAATRQPKKGVRLTPRGRLVVLVLLLLLAVPVIGFLSPASDASTPPGPAATVVVLPGESLWSIAARYRPSQDARATVEELRRINGLSGYTIYAGERLILPNRR
jgi:Tfp pilus assembly protein FimV